MWIPDFVLAVFAGRAFLSSRIFWRFLACIGNQCIAPLASRPPRSACGEYSSTRPPSRASAKCPDCRLVCGDGQSNRVGIYYITTSAICLGDRVSVFPPQMGVKSAAFREKGDNRRVLTLCLCPYGSIPGASGSQKYRRGSHHHARRCNAIHRVGHIDTLRNTGW